MRKNVALLLVLIIMASFIIMAKPALSSVDVEDSWVSKTPMNEARWGLSVAVVNDRIYAIGGSTQKGAPPYTGGIVGINEEYDPATDTWSFKAPMPTPRYPFNLVIYQNKIYCIGGSITNGGPKTGVNEVYDPLTGKWETKDSMPTPRGSFATAVYQNKIYCMGGSTENGVSGVNEVYDPTTDVWETKAAMPTAKSVDAVVVNSKIYLIGGGPNNTLNQVYDPATDSWDIKAPMPTKAYGASVVVDNKIYVVGGSYSGDQFYTLTQIYDPETDKWIQGASPPSGGVKRGTAILTTGEFAPKRIYILDKRLRVYDPETDSWTFGADKTIDRLNMGIAVANDKIYAIGGNTYSYLDPMHSIGEDPVITTYATNEQYTPFEYGTPPPVVTVISPENQTYNATSVSLVFTVNKPVVWMGYSLDGKEVIAITGNTTLSALASGVHNVTVYAKDAFENMGASETVCFSIEVPFPATLVAVASAVSVSVVGLGFLFYFKRSRTKNNRADNK